MNNFSLLTELGLDDKEARVYTALLELGISTVQPIAQKAGLLRPNTYPILDALIQQGMVSFFEKNGRRRYVAEDPTILSKKLKDRWERLNQMMPELRSLYNRNPHKPKVKYYEGKHEVRMLYEHLIEVEWYDNIYTPALVTNIWTTEFSADLGKRIAQKGVRVREILVTETPTVSYANYFKPPKQQIRYWLGQSPLPSDIILFENKVVFVTYDTDIHTIVIEGSGIVDTMRALFEQMWKSIH